MTKDGVINIYFKLVIRHLRTTPNTKSKDVWNNQKTFSNVSISQKRTMALHGQGIKELPIIWFIPQIWSSFIFARKCQQIKQTQYKEKKSDIMRNGSWCGSFKRKSTFLLLEKWCRRRRRRWWNWNQTNFRSGMNNTFV